jgi:GT2 family glycosyltransferase
VTLDNQRRLFVVIGAMKAGTTSLHQALAAHPEIGMPSRKELDYFSTVQNPSRQEYLNLFRWCRGSITGEASPSYAMYPTHGDVARRMAEVIPEAKLIFCTREPIDRMRSHYRHEVLRSRENRPADRALNDVKYLVPSLYGMQLERYLKYYDPAQIAIVTLSDLWARPDDSLQGIFDFLGVDVEWRDARGIRLVFESSSRPALTTEVERLRNTPMMRAVLGRLPTEFKQQVGFHLPGAGQATKRARALMESEKDWTPSEAIRTWFDEDAAAFERYIARCHRIGASDVPDGARPSVKARARDLPRERVRLPGTTPPPTRPVGFTPAPRGKEVPAPRLVGLSGEVVEPPRVSVAIPLYNPSVRYLAEALDSLRAQTVAPVDVVITDDSTPRREGLVRRNAHDLPVTYRANGERLGMVANWNAAVAATTGTHVILLHQDDILEPTAIERMSRVFAARPELAICGVGERRIDEDGRDICQPTRPNHRERLFISRGMHELGYGELTYLMLRNGQVFGEPSALMFSRARFDEIGGFDPAYRQSVDIDLALRMAEAGGAAYLNEQLIRRRVHAEQATQANIVNGYNLIDRRMLYRRHAVGQAFPSQAVDRVKANLAVRAGFDGLRALRYGRWPVAREAASQMMEYRPTPRALAERLVELSLWINDDAR